MGVEGPGNELAEMGDSFVYDSLCLAEREVPSNQPAAMRELGKAGGQSVPIGTVGGEGSTPSSQASNEAHIYAAIPVIRAATHGSLDPMTALEIVGGILQRRLRRP